MVQVSGPLKIMTDKASRVSEVWVGSPRTRPHGGGLLVEERDKVTPVGGALSFTSVPGPVLLTLVSGGRVVDSVRGIVPDKASATLAEVVASDHDWTPDQLTAFQQLTARAEAAASAAEADRVQTGEDRTQTGLDRTAASQSAAVAEDRAEAAEGNAQATAADRTQTGLDRQAAAQSAQGAHSSEQASAQYLAAVEPLAQGVANGVLTAIEAASTATSAADTATEQAGIAEDAADRATLIADPEGALAAKADLVGGVIPTSQIPAVALTKPHQVPDRAALLALTDVQEGDVGVITGGPDRGTLMLGDGPPSVWESWVPLATSPDAPVQSVNGQTGTVVLGAGDVGASPAIHKHTSADITDAASWSDGPDYSNRLVAFGNGGHISMGVDPQHNNHLARKLYVDQEVAALPRVHVLNGAEELAGLDAQIGDLIILTTQNEGTMGMAFMEVTSLPVSLTSGYAVISTLNLSPRSHKHTTSDITNLPVVTYNALPSTLVQRRADGQILLPTATPSANEAVRRDWVEARIAAAIADLGPRS